MAKYIMKLQELRKQHKASGLMFMEQLDKLMGNSVFGKTMEDVTKRVSIKLITDETKFAKKVSRFNFKGFKFLSDLSDLRGVEMRPITVMMNKPIAIGFTILELSKHHMFSFWYGALKPKYGDRVRMLGGDTDSIFFSIETEDWFEDIKHAPLCEYIDRSAYPSELPVFNESGNPAEGPGLPGPFSTDNKGVYGKFKSETSLITRFKDATGISCFQCPTEFIGLRAKAYSFQVLGFGDGNICDLSGKMVPMRPDVQKATAKGIVKSARKQHLKHAQYQEAHKIGATKDLVPMVVIQSQKHRIYTKLIKKKGLSALNDKRYYLGAEGPTLAFGHYKITEHREQALASVLDSLPDEINE